MSEAQTIVRILPLDDLIRAIIRKQSEWGGRMPSRIVACPVQVEKWREDVFTHPHGPRAKGYWMENLHIMGIPVVDGGSGCQPELVWSQPIEASS